jgi:hypothetical protein
VALNLRLDTAETRRLGLEAHVCEVQLVLVDFARLKVQPLQPLLILQINPPAGLSFPLQHVPPFATYSVDTRVPISRLVPIVQQLGKFGFCELFWYSRAMRVLGP